MDNSLSHIVLLATQGNRLAQKDLYTRFHKEMLGLCIRMTGKRDAAEDILQEAFIKAFTGLSKLKKPASFAGWFKRIVVNLCIDYLNTFKVIADLDVSQAESLTEQDNGFWYTDLSFDIINNEIDNLPNGCRQVLVLYLIEDYKHKDIADLLNKSVSTIKSQYQYALKILRTRLTDKYND
jgi:RNA polymerase sigma-70 factor (ECF subfamily)